MYTAGWSKFGQLGHGDFMDKPVPTLIESMKDRRVAMVCGGWRHSGAVTEDGTMYTWGWNRFGQLGTFFLRRCLKSSVPVRMRAGVC